MAFNRSARTKGSVHHSPSAPHLDSILLILHLCQTMFAMTRTVRTSCCHCIRNIPDVSHVDGFKHLQAHVATSAFDSQEHVDAPKCHPNTRQAVLNEIMDWIVLAFTSLQFVLWLNGAAGAGKSAIGRSIVELCTQRDIPIVRFFLFPNRFY